MHYTLAEHDAFARDFNRDGLVMLKFAHSDLNRGSQRFYVTLPFQDIFADPEVFEDPDILALQSDAPTSRG